MRLLTLAIISVSFAACTHSPQSPAPQAQVWPSQPHYAFETIHPQRIINTVAAKKKGVKIPEGKAVAVVACQAGQPCQGADKKVVPYAEFAGQVQKQVQQNKDVFERQEKILAKGLKQLKEEKKNLESEHAYFDHQIQTYRYSSLRPVIDNYYRSKTDIAQEIKFFDEKIQKFEKDLNYLKNNKGLRLGMDVPTERALEMIEGGQWSFATYLDKDQQLLNNLFQKVGSSFAQK